MLKEADNTRARKGEGGEGAVEGRRIREAFLEEEVSQL